MATIKELGRNAWRKWKIDGVSSSSPNEPTTDDIFPFVDQIDAEIEAVKSLAFSGVKLKQSVRLLVTTATAPAAMTAGSTHDGLVVAAGDRVARAVTPADAFNGIYVVQASGAAIRSADMDAADELVGASFTIDAGTHAAETWGCTTPAPIVVGTTALTFVKTASSNALLGEVDALGTRVDQTDAQVDTVAMLEGLSVPTAKVTEASGSINPSVFRSYSFVSGDTIEHVVVAKAAERGILQLIHIGPGAVYNATFNLNEGTITATGGANFVSAAITPMGSGWYECIARVLVAANVTNNAQARISPAGTFPYAGDGASGMYMRSFVLRKQGSTTNLLPSSNPADASFSKTNCTATNTVSPAALVVPPLVASVDQLDVLVNGRMTATKLVEQSGWGNPAFWQPRTVTNGNTVEIKVSAKKGERHRLNLFSNSGAVYNCTFDLDLGIASGTGASIAALGNGWYECTVNVTATATSSMNPQHRIFPASGGHPYVGDGVSGLFVQRSAFSINGGANVNVSPEDLSVAPWTRSAGTTATPNAGLYIGALGPGGGDESSYDDGSAALVGKKWTALGSSITIGAYYASLLAGQTGMILTNLAVSGSALGLSTTAYPSYGMSTPIATMPTDAEIVTLEPGPNAFGAQETPLGAFGDTTYGTHYGSIWKAILDIRTRAPGAKIIVFGTYSGGPGHATHRLGRTNGQGNTMDQFMRAEREVCQALGVKYVDISQSGMGYMTSTLYMSDELHPNAAGSLRYATYVAGSLRDMVRRGMFVN
ncbi:SGNH/GDSL hydrolase family protein [Mesorhizobium sp. M0938]|uniref:SGNH/GDSL hydrolase family protein n=1 Tax=unclassified Mesorhizobium TaxID=325217 RepID=UPI0033358C1E